MGFPTVILLAAGRGERYLASGGTSHKLDAMLNTRTVLEHTLAAVEASQLPWYLVRPDGGTNGMGDSIALGVTATSDASGWLILPADLPLIRPDSLTAVAHALANAAIVVPFWLQQPGHPVGFDRRYFAALSALRGDSGAKSIVRDARRQGRVTEVALDDEGIVVDIDTVSDLQSAALR